MSLTNFISRPRHFVARKRLLHMKAALEMKTHAARAGVQLQMTEPEIDNIGHDFIASVGFNAVYVQNKATLSTGKVSQWAVHAAFLQASFADRDIAPKVDMLPVGLDGAYGVILLHEVDTIAAQAGDLAVSYHYFDINFANAVRAGFWQSDRFSPDEADRLLRKIAHADPGARVQIKKRHMLRISSPSAILSFRMHIPNPTHCPTPANWMSLGGMDPDTAAHFGPIWRSAVAPWLVQDETP